MHCKNVLDFQTHRTDGCSLSIHETVSLSGVRDGAAKTFVEISRTTDRGPWIKGPAGLDGCMLKTAARAGLATTGSHHLRSSLKMLDKYKVP